MEGSELTVHTECQGKLLLFLFPASEYSVSTNQIHWQVQTRLDVILENILIVKDRLHQHPL